MKLDIRTPQALATWTGISILAAATNANVLASGNYLSSHAALVAALSAGVFAGAWVLGSGATGKIGAIILVALLVGEASNLISTGERIIVEREDRAAPLKDALAKHKAALKELERVETNEALTPRLTLAIAARTKAKTTYAKELREGGRCLAICNALKEDAVRADAEVSAAATEARALHVAEIAVARSDVEANSLPVSATPLADHIGVPPWLLDLIMAGLTSIAANGLAAALIAFGASPVRSMPNMRPFTPAPDEVTENDTLRICPKEKPRRLNKQQALADIVNRLATGQEIPRQVALASRWNRPKQTVSDWMREWRRIGVITSAGQRGRIGSASGRVQCLAC
ncbi:MAG: hypothetical protein JSR78_04095 [Proteobacteria bacterium]|nr:hypothetical protein [Pseudomonadota bacterium]